MAQRRRSVTGLNDLTQDCILWDESKNVDLRKVASPGFQTPAFDETPHDEGHQQQRPVNRRRSSLQEVSRCLPYQPEKEIESIFTRLEGDDTTKGTANVELPTQRRRNKNFGRPPSATVAELAALKSRKRQRKHDGISKPVPFSDGRTDSSGKGGGSVKTDGFEDLLQQVKTPSPSATTITAHETAKENAGNGRTPDEFGDFDISMDDLQMMESIAQNHLSQKQDTNKKEDPFGEFPDDFDFEELERKNAQMTQGTMVMAKPASNENQDDNEDPFGDFPDEIDFEALDRSNAEAIKKSHAVPPVDALVRNTRSTSVGAPSSDPSFLTFSRYKVVRLDQDPLTHTLSLWVAAWQDTMLGENDTKALHRYHESSKMALPSRKQWQADGVIHLRGEWYHTKVEEGDVIHVCSLFGKFRTDTLPLVLHTRPPPGSDPDDLVLVVHPDLLLTPTGISEAVSCPRRAILRGRLGSTGLSSEAPLFGTMRHELFEAMMKNKDFSVEFASKMIPTIARKNAEGLLSCGVTNRQAEVEVAKVVPQIQSFARLYTNLVGNHDRHIADVPLLEPGGSSPPVRFVVEELEAIEEPIISPELGLKGNLDAIVRAKTATSGVDVQTALMPVELKTGHRQQTQHAHLAQLALYTLMLGVRYGSSTQNSAAGDSNEAKRDGLLLYINNDSIRAVHVMPLLPEIKSLMGQRNVVAFESLKSSRPRGVVLSYENQGESLQNAPKVDLLDASPTVLPDVLHSSHSCERCYANRPCMLYAATEEKVANHQRAGGVPERGSSVSRTHGQLLESLTGHLSEDEFEFFQSWDRLIDLEADAEYSQIADCWLEDSANREIATSKTISSLEFDASRSSDDTVLDATTVAIAFKRSSSSSRQTPLQSLGIEPGSHVVISLDTTTVACSENSRRQSHQKLQMHLVRGFLDKCLDDEVTVRATFDDLVRIRKYAERYGSRSCHFRIDRDDVATGVGTLRQNLVNLLVSESTKEKGDVTSRKTRRAQWLREVIVKLRIPVFAVTNPLFRAANTGLHFVIPGCDMKQLELEFESLNVDQKAAVVKVMTAMDYSLIQGLPGTGKTSTIAFIARLLVAHGKRVLITSYTHAAVDNVLLKLIDNGVAQTDSFRATPALIRVGLEMCCHPGVHHILASTVAKELEGGSFDDPSADYLRRSVQGARVVGITALSIPRSPLLLNEDFDVVIVDEAGQISQPAVIGALLAADSFVLVGDHMQLPPLVKSALAEKGGYGVSMLKRLAEAHPESVARLTLQYRMNEEICQISNDIIYDGALKCANESVRHRKLDLVGFSCPVSPWLEHVLDPSLPVVFVNTDTQTNTPTFASAPRELEETIGHGSIVNKVEKTISETIVRRLLSCGMDPSEIGVICPFRAQLQILNESQSVLEWKKQGLEISTIDRYQGRDKRVIILSFVRSNQKGKVGHLLSDFRRLNVAVTRAKCKLILVGSYATVLAGSLPLRKSLNDLERKGRVLPVPEEALVSQQVL